MEETTRDGRLAFGLATAAVGWSLLITAAAFVAPAYSGGSCSATDGGPSTCTHSTQTFVEVNGLRSLLWFGLVGALAAVGWLLLHAKCAFGVRGAAGLAQLCAGALLVFSMISFGMGLFVAPIPVLLFAASVRTPQGTQSAPR